MPWWKQLALYLRLGLQHIIPEGTDHILFVLGLFFLGISWAKLLSQTTVFHGRSCHYAVPFDVRRVDSSGQIVEAQKRMRKVVFGRESRSDCWQSQSPCTRPKPNTMGQPPGPNFGSEHILEGPNDSNRDGDRGFDVLAGRVNHAVRRKEQRSGMSDREDSRL